MKMQVGASFPILNIHRRVCKDIATGDGDVCNVVSVDGGCEMAPFRYVSCPPCQNYVCR